MMNSLVNFSCAKRLKTRVNIPVRKCCLKAVVEKVVLEVWAFQIFFCQMDLKRVADWRVLARRDAGF